MNITLPEDKQMRVLILVAVVVGIVFLSSWRPFSIEPGYSTAYEGAKVRFIGLRAPDGRIYATGQTHDASVARFDTQLKFDPDDLLYDQCNLRGEMTSVFIPSSTFSKVLPDWIPTEWESSLRYIENPRQTWDWDIPNIDDTTTLYSMEEWLTKWYFTISAEFDSGPDYFMTKDESNNQRYVDWEVWFEFDIEPNWYFEGSEAAYFAIAKIELSEFKLGAEDKFGTEVTPSEETSIVPMSPPSVLYLYYVPFGVDDVVKGDDELKTFYARDVRLNPDYFRDKVYGYITLSNFGTGEWGGLLDRRAKGDVVAMGFNVYQFVVGEWKVTDVGDDPDDYGRDSQTGVRDYLKGIGDVLSGIGNWFSMNPLIGIGIFVILAIALLSFTPFFPKILGFVFGREGDD